MIESRALVSIHLKDYNVNCTYSNQFLHQWDIFSTFFQKVVVVETLFASEKSIYRLQFVVVLECRCLRCDKQIERE